MTNRPIPRWTRPPWVPPAALPFCAEFVLILLVHPCKLYFMDEDIKLAAALAALAAYQPSQPSQPVRRHKRSTEPVPTYYNGILFPSKNAAARAKPPGKKSGTVFITVAGETMSRRQWADKNGLTKDVIRKRIARGMSVEDAVTLPLSRTYDSEISQREKIHAYIMSLKNRPCHDCRNKFHPDAMEFDHCRGEKLFNISKGKKRPFSDVEAETAKCDVVCANCHRIRTAARRRG